MDTLEAIKSRRSIRQFTEQKVSREMIEELVDAGRLAATGRNVQPWEFVVVTDKKMRTKLAEIAEYGKFIADAPVCIVVVCKDCKYFLEDGSAAAQNILVTARGLGLGSCWVAGDKKPYAPQILQLLGVPEGHKLICLIAVGYQQGTTPVCKKRSLEEVLHWEKF